VSGSFPPEVSEAPAEPGISQQTLLQRIRLRDPEGWNLLLRLYGPVVHSWCRRWGLQAADSADVAQEVFCSLMRRIERFQPNTEGGLDRYLWIITRNKLRDLHRRRARSPLTGGNAYERLLDIPQQEAAGANEDAPGGGEEPFHRALLLVRGDMGERTWQAFWRCVVDEQASTAVGQELHMTANAVRLARARVLRRLRETVADLQKGRSGICNR
jgi:RNA polymerase sigma-70 factor (ECF subfamily)